MANTLSQISNFVKYNRNKLRMTQEELADKAGVGLRFIRELEQGKETLRMDKVNQVLALFGRQAVPGTERMKDPYEILRNHFNKNIRVLLKNKIVFVGFIIGHNAENNEIKEWQFVSNNNAKKYDETKDQKLIQLINHADIENIENL
ncbi:MAG: helix-turn-helix transcriptional regulator [Chitinophagaceae bacterium]